MWFLFFSSLDTLFSSKDLVFSLCVSNPNPHPSPSLSVSPSSQPLQAHVSHVVLRVLVICEKRESEKRESARQRKSDRWIGRTVLSQLSIMSWGNKQPTFVWSSLLSPVPGLSRLLPKDLHSTLRITSAVAV